MPTITSLQLYPIKSCAGISLTEANLSETGLSFQGVGDREWMVVDGTGNCLTQREFPRMALIVCTITDEALEVSGGTNETLRLPLQITQDQTRLQVQVWEAFFDALDMGEQAAQWFSEFLGTNCRLVRFKPGVKRLSDAAWTAGEAVPNLFSDGFPLLVISEASLQDLNNRAAAQAGAAFPMNRFRPNLVIAGVEAFEEDYAESIAIQDENRNIVLTPVKPCARCPIPSVDQSKGEFSANPLDLLQTYRANPLVDGGITFGMNLIVTAGNGQMLRVGDAIGMPIKFD